MPTSAICSKPINIPFFYFAKDLRRQRNPYLHAGSCIYRRRGRRNIWIYPSLIKIQLYIDAVADVIIQRRAYRNFFAAVGGKGAVLIQNTVRTYVVPDANRDIEIDFVVQRFGIFF